MSVHPKQELLVQLIDPSRSVEANYRVYSAATAERLKFIRAAQATGFSLKDIREMLALTYSDDPPCAEVAALIENRLADVQQAVVTVAAEGARVDQHGPTNIARTAQAAGSGTRERRGDRHRRVPRLGSRPATPLSRHPPSVHQMVLTLERAGLIRRQPGVARSIELLVAPEDLPVLC